MGSNSNDKYDINFNLINTRDWVILNMIDLETTRNEEKTLREAYYTLLENISSNRVDDKEKSINEAVTMFFRLLYFGKRIHEIEDELDKNSEKVEYTKYTLTY